MQHIKWTMKYDLTEERVTTQDGEAGVTYGLTCLGSHPQLPRGAVLASLPDISCDLSFVHAMAELFTIGSLPPERLREAVAVLL